MFLVLPSEGRRHRLAHRVRLGDVGPHGRARLDAVARYLQDVAGDDGEASGVGGVWVLRRVALRNRGRWPRLGDDLEMLTFCSGSGSRWAERRTIVAGPGGTLDAAAIWVLVDRSTGRPQPLPPTFAAVYGGPAAARRVSSRLGLPAPGDGVERMGRWSIRAADLDVLGHVNNARYWEAVEDVLAARSWPEVHAAVLEFRAELGPADEPELLVDWQASAVGVWLRSTRALHAAAVVRLAGSPSP